MANQPDLPMKQDKNHYLNRPCENSENAFFRPTMIGQAMSQHKKTHVFLGFSHSLSRLWWWTTTLTTWRLLGAMSGERGSWSWKHSQAPNVCVSPRSVHPT